VQCRHVQVRRYAPFLAFRVGAVTTRPFSSNEVPLNAVEPKIRVLLPETQLPVRLGVALDHLAPSTLR